MMSFVFTAFVVALTLGAVSAGQATNSQDPALATVQTFVKANETANLQLMLSTFDDDATVFFPGVGVLPPARASGKAQIQGAFEALFKGRTGPLTITPRDVVVQMFGQIAIVTLHLRDLPTQPVQETVSFPRRTFVLRQVGERWLIVHHHASNAQISPPARRP